MTEPVSVVPPLLLALLPLSLPGFTGVTAVWEAVWEVAWVAGSAALSWPVASLEALAFAL